MTSHHYIRTSREVWEAIRKQHHDLHVFHSYSAPLGDQFGDPDKGIMSTSYGFSNCEFPIISAETTWDIDHENPSNRENETTHFWLCYAIKEE